MYNITISYFQSINSTALHIFVFKYTTLFNVSTKHTKQTLTKKNPNNKKTCILQGNKIYLWQQSIITYNKTDLENFEQSRDVIIQLGDSKPVASAS